MRRKVFSIWSVLLVLVLAIAALIPSCTSQTVTTGCTIDVEATFDGTRWTGGVQYTLTGPAGASITGTSVDTSHNVSCGSWTCAYVSGGPAGASLVSITPLATQTVSAVGTITFTLDFVTPANIDVEATLDGTRWTGGVQYTLTGPAGASITGTSVDTSHNASCGSWTCAYVSGGPAGASFINITPSPTQVLSAGATITFTLNFVRPPRVLDHFKCYTIENGEFLWDYVYLEDQFIALEAEVGRAYSFCNPVKKTYEDEVTEINDYDHHLTTYGLVYEGVENPQKWSVQVDNQFGVQQMIVEGPKGIAVPTQKLEPGGHGPPVGLDHFMLYDVVHATSVDVHVDLDDEFADHSGVLVTSPIMLANPVRKTDAAGMVTDIQMGEHLVFYYISQVPVNYPQVRVVNQFGEQTFAMYHTDFFGVPSDKISFEPYEEPESLALDHFACYNLSQTSNVTFITPPPWQVYVEDQFIAGGAEVGLPLRFCNPTEKTYSATVTPILDADHHLTVYSLEWCAVVGQWSVQFKNQFGTQQLTVQGPVALAVPTQKLEPGDHDPPGGLDHFLLYDVLLGGGTMWLVNLHDEFGYQPNVDVLAPLYFANPVKKTDAAGMVTEIQNPEAHLVFYDTSVANLYTYPQATGVDQFAQWYHVNLDGPWHLAVPSEKLSWQQQPLGWMPYWWTP